jgi:hypothetical protein
MWGQNEDPRKGQRQLTGGTETFLMFFASTLDVRESNVNETLFLSRLKFGAEVDSTAIRYLAQNCAS